VASNDEHDEHDNQIVVNPPTNVAAVSPLETETAVDANVINGDSTPVDHQADQHLQQKISERHLASMLAGTDGSTRERLWRLALIMDHLDWAQIRSRADLMGSLWEEESNQVSRTSADTTDLLAMGERVDRGVALHQSARDDLFVDSHVARLQNHPRFGAGYNATEFAATIGGQTTPHGHASQSTQPSPIPGSSHAPGSRVQAIPGVVSTSSLPAVSRTLTPLIGSEESNVRTAREDEIEFRDAWDYVQNELLSESDRGGRLVSVHVEHFPKVLRR
jgi:hypothetical protein